MAESLFSVDPMRSKCPIANTLDIVGDKWTLLIIRDVVSGKHRYGEFQTSPEGIPTNILSNRLKVLVESGVLNKVAYQSRPTRYEYILTQQGRQFVPLILFLKNWGLENIKSTAALIEI